MLIGLLFLEADVTCLGTIFFIDSSKVNDNSNDFWYTVKKYCKVRDKSFVILYYVLTDPCLEHECVDGGICQLNEVRAPVCRCGPPCNLIVRPGSAVCGSDFKDYASECSLRRESCRTRQQLSIAYRGECASGKYLKIH